MHGRSNATSCCERHRYIRVPRKKQPHLQGPKKQPNTLEVSESLSALKEFSGAQFLEHRNELHLSKNPDDRRKIIKYRDFPAVART